MQATKEPQSKGNISLLESSRLESLLLSLRKEKNELENNLIGLHGELNLLLSLPTGQEVTLLLDDEILKQVDAATVSFTDMSRMLSVRPDLKMAQCHSRSGKPETTTVAGRTGVLHQRDVRPGGKLY